MPLPIIIPIAAGAAALYLLLTSSSGKATSSSGKVTSKENASTVKQESGGTVTTVVPTVDGKGYKLTTTPAKLGTIMAEATQNDAGKMTVLAAKFKAKGDKREATACNHLAAVIATNKATGGKPVSEATATTITQQAAAAVDKVTAVKSDGATFSDPNPSTDLVSKLKKAVEEGNVANLRKLADQLDAAGFPMQAAAARAAADDLESSLKEAKTAAIPPILPTPTAQTPAVITTPGVATAPQFTPAAIPQLPALPAATPALPTPLAQAPLTQRRLAADALVRHLSVDRPGFGKENQAIVKAYESALGESPSGKYGLGLAYSLAEPESGAHVPPPPRYWPASATSIAKWGNYIKSAEKFDQWLMSEQMKDQARSAEWQSAYQHARDFWPSGSKPQPRK